MKKLLAALLFLFSVSALGADYSSIRNATYPVFVQDETGDTIGSGSGVMIAPTIMLTAAHIVADSAPEQIKIGIDNVSVVTVTLDTKLDLAVLRVQLGCPCVPVSKTIPAIDTKVVTIGYPLYPLMNGVQYATNGLIQGVVGHGLYISSPIMSGNSGGGIFVNFPHVGWRLVGVAQKIATVCMTAFSCAAVSHLAVAVDTKTIQDFLK